MEFFDYETITNSNNYAIKRTIKANVNITNSYKEIFKKWE